MLFGVEGDEVLLLVIFGGSGLLADEIVALKFPHEVGKGIVKVRFIAVVLLEDGAGEVGVMCDEVLVTNDNEVFPAVQDRLSHCYVLPIPELLEETGEFSLYIIDDGL